MTLRSTIKSDAFNVFLQTDEFAECVTYHFAAGGSRSIKAIVDREPPSFYGPGGDVVTPKYMVTIHNDNDTGVCTSDVDTGGDQVELMKEFGNTVPEKVTVLMVAAEDMGMITLALR